MRFNNTPAKMIGATADPVRVFPDPNLEAAVRTAVGVPVGDIHQSDLDKVATFSSDAAGIVSLVGMEYWTTLTSLTITNDSVTDISPLSGLTALTYLDLTGNDIADLSYLTGLISLISLFISDTDMTVIPDLSSLTSLTELGVDTNSGLSDLSPLAGLTSLELLSAFDSNISDISPLASLTSLIYLGLEGNSIVDISAIAMTSGDLDLMDNPLNAAAYSMDIPALIAAGVTVNYDPTWRSPDGFVEEATWFDEALAYDGNTATYAYVPQNLNMWTDWCRFTFSAPVLTPTQLRIWMSHEVGATPKTCHVKAYDGDGGEETLVYDGIAEDQYVTVAVASLTKISYIEVRFEGQTGVTFNIYLNEVAVYGK